MKLLSLIIICNIILLLATLNVVISNCGNKEWEFKDYRGRSHVCPKGINKYCSSKYIGKGTSELVHPDLQRACCCSNEYKEKTIRAAIQETRSVRTLGECTDGLIPISAYYPKYGYKCEDGCFSKNLSIDCRSKVGDAKYTPSKFKYCTFVLKVAPTSHDYIILHDDPEYKDDDFTLYANFGHGGELKKWFETEHVDCIKNSTWKWAKKLRRLRK